MLVLDTPPRWRGMLAVVAVHALLLVWLGQTHRALPSAQELRPTRQPTSTVKMVTIQLSPLRHREATPTPTPVPSAREPQRPARQRPLATDTARATAEVDAAPLAAKAASTATKASTARTAPAPEPLAVDARKPPASAPESLPQPAAQSALQSPSPAASGPSGRELMDGAATRLAIRQSTRGTPLLSERADQASQAPERLDASARLGREIKEAGHGDCLKGEYAGGGMGLLSAPFLLLAKARGQCAK
ncbi:hypothetical protein DES44_4517 [Roseateles depolymerans]|uniref:Uncharacterized protein n=2 Tax=Roseateles depolymerans TaxID=76731 RepID=A0A0U3MBP6_9BURK|nr:hypothetical protein RD2015_1624 [Roseateles depolymerans]REG11915.1 hypothetical protein DES44_4517 [Roseateles depolymerans]